VDWQSKYYEVEPLERIAQLLIIPILHVNFQVVDRFTSQEVRQQDGFGSTGRR
jgi:dUTP pyrophosphatase